MKNNNLNEFELRELDYKLDTIKKFLIIKNGKQYKLYNHCCPNGHNKPDSNIIEYFDDVIYFIEKLKG